ncbi:hypothetical protein Dimus_013484, partial [Dionaea muscipula]
ACEIMAAAAMQLVAAMTTTARQRPQDCPNSEEQRGAADSRARASGVRAGARGSLHRDVQHVTTAGSAQAARQRAGGVFEREQGRSRGSSARR